MAGYDGYSMSNNATHAYACGEKPLSKWTRAEILDAIGEIAEENELNFNLDLLKKVSLSALKSELLLNSSWHHTSKFYNCTDFYSLDEEKIITLTDEDILEMAKIKEPAKKKTAEEKEVAEKAKEIYDKLNIIYLSNITKLKSFGGVVGRWTSGKMDIEKTYADALEALRVQEERRVDCWRKLPAEHWRQEYVSLFDSDFEKYVYKYIAKDGAKSRKALDSIKVAISKNVC